MQKEDLLEALKTNIQFDIYHPNYQRTVDLAVLYSQIISGKDIDLLLKQFVRREDETMFKQRVNITQQITPSISSGIIKTFNKVFRTAPATEAIDFEEGEPADRVAEVKAALSTIYGKKDIYKYFQDRFLYLSFTDPNAFIYTTFDPFDNKREKAKPYNIEISSASAINYEYFNNVLQWLITKSDCEYTEAKKVKHGFIWTIYGPGYAYVLTQVGKDYVVQNDEVVIEVPKGDKKGKFEYFIVDEYNHKSEVIPVVQVGYERDPYTEGETFVSPLEPGMPYFMKSIKTVSEFDLTMALHAFPQKFMYADKCSFRADGKCESSGKNMEQCRACNSTGIKVHTSAQDAIVLKLPKDKDEMFDLSSMVHYEHPPQEILDFQDKMIDKYASKVNKSIFNSETFTLSQVQKTATGENIDMQNVYDTLKPFAEKVSDVWEHITMVVANYLDYTGVIVSHAYPNDFKLKTDAELLEELNKATTGGAAGYVISSIEADIMRRKYIDDPLEFQTYLAKKKFFPFNGKTQEQIDQIILSGMVRENDVILCNYFETIFAELEEEYLEKGIWYYDLSPLLQRQYLTKKIEEIKADIKSQGAIVLDVEPIVS